MATIKPFRAVTYNQDKINDYSGVVCPPYDVISPEAQERYHDTSPHNLIHILLGKDIAGEDKYRRARIYFKDWQNNKILIQDETPTIYFYSQQYKIRGEQKTRLGFISLLRLDDKNARVFGHEHTRLAPKEDRLRLLKQVKANLSPIFVIFPDKKRIIQRAYQQYIVEKKPFIDIVDEENTVHKLWRLDDADSVNKIQARMQEENIFIADGHHRYEVACAFRNLMKHKLGSRLTGEEGFNYILTYFTNTDSRGLTILPIHRLVKLGTPLGLKKFFAALSEYFDLEEIKEKARFFFLMEKGGKEHVLGMYKDKIYWLLRLKNIKILESAMRDKPKVYRSLDVAILNALILKKALNLDLEDKESIAFSPQANELIEEADKNPLRIAFFLNPVKIEQIISVALDGEKMPSKSTYFYPKVLSGLVINKFD